MENFKPVCEICGLNHYETNPPTWLAEMAIAALSDERYATKLENAGFVSDTFLRISYLADERGELTDALGYSHCNYAVPFLIEMARKTNGRRGPVMALGNMGDPRAIPLLIDLVMRKGPLEKRRTGYGLSDEFFRPVVALGQLKAKEAVPVLLEYIQHPEVIEALETIGDSRAIQPLERLIQTNGRIGKSDVDSDPKLPKARVIAARIAVAVLDTEKRTERLCGLLTDASFDEFQRRSVVWQLGYHPDSAAIPFLAKAIKSDPSGAVVNQAITVLAEFKYKTAVDVLIDSFDADFRGKRDWKRAYEPEMFRDNIAESLRRLTEQSIGADKTQWQKWWKQSRDAVSNLK